MCTSVRVINQKHDEITETPYHENPERETIDVADNQKLRELHVPPCSPGPIPYIPKGRAPPLRHFQRNIERQVAAHINGWFVTATRRAVRYCCPVTVIGRITEKSPRSLALFLDLPSSPSLPNHCSFYLEPCHLQPQGPCPPPQMLPEKKHRTTIDCPYKLAGL